MSRKVNMKSIRLQSSWKGKINVDWKEEKKELTSSTNLTLITNHSSFCPGQVSMLPKPQPLTHLLAVSDGPKTKKSRKQTPQTPQLYRWSLKTPRKIMTFALLLCVLLRQDWRHPFPELPRLIKLHLTKFTFKKSQTSLLFLFYT